MEKTNETHIVSYCGLYCNNCAKFQKGRCPGCRQYDKATWCKIRTCCKEHGYKSCADCKEMTPRECRNYNNIFAKFFEVVFRSDRKGAIEYIKKNGDAAYVSLMKERNSMVLKVTRRR